MSKKEEPIKNTVSPIIVGGSVIGMKYKNGVIIATDTILNYGSYLSQFKQVYNKVQQITPRTIIGYSGEYSDLQETSRILKEMVLEDSLEGNGTPVMGPVELSNYLASLHYYKRNKMDPYLNNVITGGIDWNGDVILMNVDPYGTCLSEANYYTTSLGHYFCNSIIAPEFPADFKQMTKEKCIDLLKKSFTCLYYRHLMAGDVIKVSSIEKNEQNPNDIKYQEELIKLDSKWDYDMFKNYSNETYYLTS